MRRKADVVTFQPPEEGGNGEFEALVAVFGNVDSVGDRVIKGAFTKSLEEWKASGDPIPVIFSHQWDNLHAHVGEVFSAEERDEGLYVKARLDLEDDFARDLWKKMKRRRIREMSFAYDVVHERKADDGANDLTELKIIEVGPTLKGINPETQLLAVKSSLEVVQSEIASLKAETRDRKAIEERLVAIEALISKVVDQQKAEAEKTSEEARAMTASEPDGKTGDDAARAMTPASETAVPSPFHVLTDVARTEAEVLAS